MWIIRPKIWNRPSAGQVCSCCGRRMPAPKGARKLVRPAKVDALLDTRTRGELLLAGESPVARDRAERRATKKGAPWRTIRVRLADGFECVTGSYLVDDGHAKAQAVRYARARAMEREFERQRESWRTKCEWQAAMRGGETGMWDVPEFDSGFRWVRVLGLGYSVRARACEVAPVEAAEFWPEWHSASERLRQAVHAFMSADLDHPEVEERKAA